MGLARLVRSLPVEHNRQEIAGVAGIVIYGAIRDVAYMRARKFPIFAAGISHRGPYKDGPGEPVASDTGNAKRYKSCPRARQGRARGLRA